MTSVVIKKQRKRGRGAQRLVLPVNEPKKTGARCAQTHLYIAVLHIWPSSQFSMLYFCLFKNLLVFLTIYSLLQLFSFLPPLLVYFFTSIFFYICCLVHFLSRFRQSLLYKPNVYCTVYTYISPFHCLSTFPPPIPARSLPLWIRM